MKYTFTFKCTVCQKEHIKSVANLSSAVNNRLSGEIKVFCSADCRKIHLGSLRQSKICPICNKEFKYSPANTNQRCCSQKCNGIHQSENAEKYDLAGRANRARANYTKESTAKMLQTKVDRGLLNNWKEATWKQFWRSCNWITFKRRKELVDDWDGYDYIDGEYIRENLNLPHSHGDYPTLDHVIPRSQFYKEGKTPQEACEVSNLKWTKRRNNSKKYNK